MKSSKALNRFTCFSPYLAERSGTFSEKYDLTIKNSGSDVIPLSVADMDFPCMSEITEELIRKAHQGNYGYSFRSDGFYSSVKNWMHRRNGWNINESWVEFIPGTGSGLAFSLLAVTDPYSSVVIQPPVYPVFKRLAVNNGRQLLENPLLWDGCKYAIDFDDLEKKLRIADALILCNPQNPTGRVFSREELEKLGRLCLEYDVFIISDEIHCDIVQETYHHTPIGSISEELKEITITLISPGKSFNLCGLSTSATIIPNEKVRKKFKTVYDKFHIDQGNLFGTAALEIAYTYGDTWLDECNSYIGENIRSCVDFINENIPEVNAYAPEGTFLMWLDCRNLGFSHVMLQDFLINRAGLVLSDGRLYGVQGDGFMRMNIGTTREVLHRALNQFKKAVREIHKLNA